MAKETAEGDVLVEVAKATSLLPFPPPLDADCPIGEPPASVEGSMFIPAKGPPMRFRKMLPKSR